MEIGALASSAVLMLGPGHTIREAARAMSQRNVGSAVVVTEDGRPAILTERDILRATASGDDLDRVTVERYMTSNPITASPSWDVLVAAEEMRAGGFRHLIVLDEAGSVGGILSIRDLVSSLLDHVADSGSGEA
jgi:CBS domain-containing protein